MIPRMTKTTLHKLFKEWTWRDLTRRKYVGNLIFTGNGGYRKDNRVVQNVGKPAIKFRFDVGPYLGGPVTSTPRHFSISTTGNLDRISWMAMPGGDVFLKRRVGKVWKPPVKMTDFFLDCCDIQKEELEMLEFLYPGITAQVVELLPGLHGIDSALWEKFCGKGPYHGMSA